MNLSKCIFITKFKGIYILDTIFKLCSLFFLWQHKNIGEIWLTCTVICLMRIYFIIYFTNGNCFCCCFFFHQKAAVHTVEIWFVILQNAVNYILLNRNKFFVSVNNAYNFLNLLYLYSPHIKWGNAFSFRFNYVKHYSF